MTTDKQTLNTRVRKLEQNKPDERHEIRVYWGNPSEPKPTPGEWVIEWVQDDTFTKQRIKEGKQDANRSTT